MPARLGLAGHDVDGAAEAALVLHVERPLADLDPVHLGEVHVEGGGVHVVRAGAVDPLAVDQDVQVAALQPPQDDLVRDAALAQPPQAGLPAERLAHVDGRGLPQLRRLERRARGLAHDAHRLAQARDVEGEVEPRLLPGANGDGGGDPLREAGEGGAHLVGARGELAGAERAQAPRGDLRAPAVGAGDGQHDAGEPRAVARGDRAREATPRFLRAGQRGGQPRHAQPHARLHDTTPPDRGGGPDHDLPDGTSGGDQAGRGRFGGGTGGACGRSSGASGGAQPSSRRASARRGATTAGRTASSRSGAPITTASGWPQPQRTRRQGRPSPSSVVSPVQQQRPRQQKGAGSSARTALTRGSARLPSRTARLATAFAARRARLPVRGLDIRPPQAAHRERRRDEEPEEERQREHEARAPGAAGEAEEGERRRAESARALDAQERPRADRAQRVDDRRDHQDARGGARGQDGGQPQGGEVEEHHRHEPDDQGERQRARALPAHRPGGEKRGDPEEDGRRDERRGHEQQEAAEALRPGARVDDRPRGAEAHRLGGGQRLEEAEELAEQDRPARHRLGEHELGGAAVGGQGQDADEQRGERHEEQHELDEGDGGAREVLDAVAAGEHVAGPGHPEGQDAEHHGEDLGPTRAEGEHQLLPREQTQVAHAPPRGSGGRGGRAPPGGHRTQGRFITGSRPARKARSRRRAGPSSRRGRRPGTRRRRGRSRGSPSASRGRARACRRRGRPEPRPSSGGRPRRRWLPSGPCPPSGSRRDSRGRRRSAAARPGPRAARRRRRWRRPSGTTRTARCACRGPPAPAPRPRTPRRAPGRAAPEHGRPRDSARRHRVSSSSRWAFSDSPTSSR